LTADFFLNCLWHCGKEILQVVLVGRLKRRLFEMGDGMTQHIMSEH